MVLYVLWGQDGRRRAERALPLLAADGKGLDAPVEYSERAVVVVGDEGV